MPDLTTRILGDKPLDFVTVFFDGDRRQLDLFRAGSAKFVPGAAVASISLVYNGFPGIPDDEAKRIRALFGRHSRKVQLIHESEILASSRNTGWVTQQILKLTATAMFDAPHAIMLDTENVFCKPVDASYFLTPDGRNLCEFCDFSDHPLAPWLTTTLRFFDLDHSLLGRFPQTVTPFVMDSDIVRDLLRSLDACGMDLESTCDDIGVTEFFLYAAFVQAKAGTLAGHFAERGYPHGLTIWHDLPDAEKLARELEELRSSPTSIFSVHRDAMPKLDGMLGGVVADFWVDCGLLASRAAARDFLDTVPNPSSGR